MGELPRRVLFVMHAAGGGAALSTLDLIRGLEKRGIESAAVCDPAGTQAQRDDVEAAVHGRVLFRPLYTWNRRIRADRWKRPLIWGYVGARTGWTRTSSADVIRVARKHDVDLIHTNTSLNPEGGIAARRTALPHVWHVRELLGPGQPFRLWRERRAFGRYVARHAAVVIANSDVTAGCVRPWLQGTPLQVVHNGVDVSTFEARSHEHDGPVVVAMVAGTNSRSKQHALFIEVASLTPSSLNVEFRVYGAGADREQLRTDRYGRGLLDSIAKLGLGERFKWAGFVSDKRSLFSQIDVLVHPNAGESFGRIAVEAMAAGVPVVGVRAGGIGEVVDDGVTGLLAEPGDALGLATLVHQLAVDPSARHRLGTAGRVHAERAFSIDAHVAGVLRAYATAMSITSTDATRVA